MMKFFDKLKQTLWKSFFGAPEKSSKSEKAKTKKGKRKVARGVPKKASKKTSPQKEGKVAGEKVLRKLKLVKKKPKSLKIKTKTQGALKSQAVAKSAASKTTGVSPSRKARAVVPAPVVDEGLLIGRVTHFFPQVKAAAIKIEASALSIGDTIRFEGATTDYKIKIQSMQINRNPVTQAAKGSEIGILVKKRVREGDLVYKL